MYPYPSLVCIIVARALAMHVDAYKTIANHVKRRQTEKSYTLSGHSFATQVFDLSYHPDGTQLASGGADRTVRLWNTTGDGSPIATLEDHSQVVKSVIYSPDRTLMASGSGDKTIKLWNITDGGSLVKTLSGHTGGVKCLSFNFDGSLLASGSEDNSIMLWNITDGYTLLKILRSGPSDESEIYSVSFHPDGTRLAAGADAITIWNTADYSLIETFGANAHFDVVASLTYNHDGSQLACGSLDFTISVWKTTEAATLIGKMNMHTNAVNSVSYSPDGRRLASGSADYTIRIWDMTDIASISNGGKVLKIFTYDDQVESVSYNSDGSQLASGRFRGSITVWLMDTTLSPTTVPTKIPTKVPTDTPTKAPTKAPTKEPTTREPTKVPTIAPTISRPEREKTSKTPMIVGLVVGGIFFVGAIFFCWRNMKHTFSNLFVKEKSFYNT